MNKLLLHHRYIDLPPVDQSGYGNDGVAQDIFPGAGALSHTASFDGVGSWIHIPRSISMDHMVQIRVQVTFRLDANAPAGRMNLVEGFLSFAVWVVGDGSVHFSIVDRDGDWTVCSSAPGLVGRGRWHTLVAAHDGVSEARIALDAAVVARSTRVVGRVRSIGREGIALGRWPDSARYQFRGLISEVAVYKFDHMPELQLIFGAGCVKHEAASGALGRIAEEVGPEALAEWATLFNDFVRDACEALQVGADDTDEMRLANARVMAGLAERDFETFGSAVSELRRRARRHVGEQEQRALLTRLAEIRRALPVDDDQLTQLGKLLCLDRLVEPRN